MKERTHPFFYTSQIYSNATLFLRLLRVTISKLLIILYDSRNKEHLEEFLPHLVSVYVCVRWSWLRERWRHLVLYRRQRQDFPPWLFTSDTCSRCPLSRALRPSWSSPSRQSSSTCSSPISLNWPQDTGQECVCREITQQDIKPMRTTVN